MLTCESALMAKVCEMIVNRDYIRENNAGHPPRASHRTYRLLRARGNICATRAYLGIYVCMRVCTRTCVRVRVCMRARCFHARVWKKAAGRAGGRGREDVDIFLRATRECRERHAFDWPGVVGAAAGETMGRG